MAAAGFWAMLKTRSRVSDELTHRLTRWRNSAVPIAQAASAAGLAWLVSVHVVAHRSPFFAPIAAVICVGLAVDQRRLRRAMELIVGVSLGVGVGDVLISIIGTGAWQIALLVALAMSIAVLLDGGAIITLQAAVSTILVGHPNGGRGAGRRDRPVSGGAPPANRLACS